MRGDRPDGGPSAGPSPAPGHLGPDDEVDGGVDVSVADGVTVVRFWGSVDLVVREAQAGGLSGLRGTTPMTIDCRDVEFMDSTGLSLLVRIARDAAADGRDARFLGASDQVRDLMATTGVDAWMSGLGVDGVPTA
jgi:anti-anti-sigma factor